MAILCGTERGAALIKVDPMPEYPGFDIQVRQPGIAFLAITLNPSSEQFRKKNFWSRALRELHAAYSGICAYTCVYLPDYGSVDHYTPKTVDPRLAYEWSNFRLCSGRVNSNKGNSTEVLDPFLVENGWFRLDLPSCLIKATPGLPPDIKAKVNSSINALRLNSDDTYVQERCAILIDLARGDITFNFLSRRYPFLAMEVERQGVAQDLKKILSVH